MRQSDIDDIREALAGPCDRCGECDICHREPCELWDDHTEEGGFTYCRPCWLRIIERERKAVKK